MTHDTRFSFGARAPMAEYDARAEAYDFGDNVAAMADQFSNDMRALAEMIIRGESDNDADAPAACDETLWHIRAAACDFALIADRLREPFGWRTFRFWRRQYSRLANATRRAWRRL